MQRPVNITYRGVEKSDAIDQFILEKAARLEKFCDHINRCDVAIEQPNHAHQKGNPFRVRIDVTVPPGHELVADEKQTDNGAHKVPRGCRVMGTPVGALCIRFPLFRFGIRRWIFDVPPGRSLPRKKCSYLSWDKIESQ